MDLKSVHPGRQAQFVLVAVVDLAREQEGGGTCGTHEDERIAVIHQLQSGPVFDLAGGYD